MPDQHPRQVEHGGAPRWVRLFWISTILLLVAFGAMHLTGHGLGHHGGMP